ncbi:hypothetical protein FJT64_001408 [Amphibalanus amphitrite]|uniref:Retrotransposon gag domain-containing protein n=1 Tax=Amphibalanus amphitrite TaxID=1232801 RepID=A0A6A4VCM4_AMPAM|nr:hypothetical protein FJT64_001408 [Amphibalanus amphitrite]
MPSTDDEGPRATYGPDQSTYSVLPPAKNLGALREIPVFEPDKEGSVGVGDFLEAVENAASLGNLDANDIMKVMPMRLRGPAKGFLKTYLASKQVGSDVFGLGHLWKDFKRGLFNRFRKPTDPVAHLLQLTSCQQGDTETARGYAQRLKSLAYKTWPQFTQSQDEPIRQLGEKLIYQHFLKGLKPTNLERIHLKGIGDMDAAVIELTSKETFDALQRSGGRSVRVNQIGEETPRALEEIRGAVRELRETVATHIASTAEALSHALGSHTLSAPYSAAGHGRADALPFHAPVPPAYGAARLPVRPSLSAGGGIRLRSVTGGELANIGEAVLMVEIGAFKLEHKMCVIQGLPYDVLLGIDFIKASRMVLNAAEGCVQIGSSRVPFASSCGLYNGPRAVCLSTDVTVPSRHVCVIAAKLDTAGRGSSEKLVEFVPQPPEETLEPFLEVPSLVAKTNSAGYIQIPLVNPTEDDIQLPAGYELGQTQLYEGLVATSFVKLNSITETLSYPLPNMQRILEDLGRNKGFVSSMDMTKSFYQIRVLPECAKLAGGEESPARRERAAGSGPERVSPCPAEEGWYDAEPPSPPPASHAHSAANGAAPPIEAAEAAPVGPRARGGTGGIAGCRFRYIGRFRGSRRTTGSQLQQGRRCRLK